MNSNNPLRRALLAGSGVAASLTFAWGQTAKPPAADGQPYVTTALKASEPAQFKPSVSAMLALEWDRSLNPSLYLVSEKLDGVRALWDGRILRFRSGRTINAPAWFVAGLPKTPLDGELWIAHQQFDLVSGTVRRANAVDTQWRVVRYRVFDIPGDARPFAQRAAAMVDVVQTANTPWLEAIKHTRFADAQSLQKHLAATIAMGGEGLMLHHQDAIWRSGRSSDLRKLKATPDDDALVVAHIPGKGKFKGQMGALLLQMPDGKRFALGTGFTEAQREQPPAIGSTVTYRFRERTSTGLPRFASFLRANAPDLM